MDKVKMENIVKLKGSLFLALLVLLGIRFKIIAATTDDPFWFSLAVNRTVTQSTTATNGEAEKAVNGKVNPKPDQCARTDGSSSPYLVIDLGEEMFPTSIQIQLDHSNAPDVYERFAIRLGNSADHLSNAILRRHTVKLISNTFNVMSKGRYLSVELEDTVVLSVCEVFVYNTPFDQVGYGKPVTLSKSSENARSNPSYGRPWVLTDQATYLAGYSDYMQNPWIRIDLVDSYYVREVIIFASIRQMKDFAVRIGESLVDGGRGNPSCAEHQNIDSSGAQAFFCRMKGRYIVLTIDSAGRLRAEATEVLINPSHQKNHAEGLLLKISSLVTQNVPSNNLLEKATDNSPGPNGFIGIVGVNGFWVRLELGISISVGKIIIAAMVPEPFKDQLVDFELRVGDSLDNEGNSNPLCLEGLQSLLGKEIESFYCEPPVPGQYVNLNQKTTDKHLTLTEFAVYSEFPPNMKNRFGEGKQVWGKIGEDIELLCSAHGQPTPVLSWIKDGVTLNTDSNTLKINSATVEDSGIYECWANNTHGEEYMPFYVNITSEIRPCAESLEIEHDLGKIEYSSNEIRGNKWYRFYDGTSKSFLVVGDKKKNSTCNAWIKDTHPGSTHAVVKRTVCVQEYGKICNREYEIRIKNCLGYYVYNLPWSQASKNVKYCFKPDQNVRQRPAISTKLRADHALLNHVFQTELDIQDSSQCLVMCGLISQCKSFNYSDKEKICELNSSTKQEHPGDFLARNGFGYFMKGSGMANRRFVEDF